ncbi:MAG: hypothetical protein WBA99_18220 [Nodosilinea sp.]
MPPNRQDLAGTLVLALPIAEASAKVRTGPPIDAADNYTLYTLPIWAGKIPLGLTTPAPDPKCSLDLALPDYAISCRRQVRQLIGIGNFFGFADIRTMPLFLCDGMTTLPRGVQPQSAVNIVPTQSIEECAKF